MFLAGSSYSDSAFSLNQIIFSLVLQKMSLHKLKHYIESYGSINREVAFIISGTRARTTVRSCRKHLYTHKTLQNCLFNYCKSLFNECDV